MDILGITEENKDLDMIQNIAKEGMKYFDRFVKIKKEEHPRNTNTFPISTCIYLIRTFGKYQVMTNLKY